MTIERKREMVRSIRFMKRHMFLTTVIISLATRLYSADIVVTTIADVENGDVSTPDALVGNPGPDGISLREAIAAANNVTGPHLITFTAGLSGKKIALLQPLEVTRNGLTLTGLTDASGKPSITLDGSAVAISRALFYVHASDFSMSSFRLAALWDGLAVRAGRSPAFLERQAISNIHIENNIFEHSPTTPNGAAVRVYMEPEGQSLDAAITNVRIIRNTFLFKVHGEAVNVAANGRNCLIRDVLIEGNTLFRSGISVETAGGSGNKVLDTRIVRNAMLRASNINVFNVQDPLPNSESVVDSTLISENFFSVSPKIQIVGGQGKAQRNTVSNTQIVNNLMTGVSEISLIGGKFDPASVGNRVQGVKIMNNTFSPCSRGYCGGVAVVSNLDGASGNSVGGLSIINTIFDLSGYNFYREIKPDQVKFCITSQPGFAGRNGNLSADPGFVNSAGGNFHLSPESAAIDAGLAHGAPSTDLDCRERIGRPDIGAFEFGHSPIKRLMLTTAGSGRGSVTVDPTGVMCGRGASLGYESGTVVNLLPVPASGSVFKGWSGHSDCNDGIVTMTGHKACTARFEVQSTKSRE